MERLRGATFILLAVLLGLTLPSARAAVIPLKSGDGINESNNITGPNVLIAVHPAWQPNAVGQWVSYADTGQPGTVAVPNVGDFMTLPNPNPPSAIFYEVFVLPYGHNTGHVDIWADDTARVYLDQTLLIDAYAIQGDACTALPIGCTPGNGASFDLTALHLAAGQHAHAGSLPARRWTVWRHVPGLDCIHPRTGHVRPDRGRTPRAAPGAAAQAGLTSNLDSA